METDRKLKQELLGQLSNVYDAIPVYLTRKLSSTEMEQNAKYYASRFIGRDSQKSFASAHRENGSTLIKLPWDTKMRIYHDSDAISIRRKMNLLENLINEEFDVKRQSEIANHVMKKLELDKFRLPFEQVELEGLGQIKASGVNIEGKKAPVVVCRIVATFRRYINNIPVYGTPSIVVRIAGDDLIESVGINWRYIEERPIEHPRIIKPEIAAELILKGFTIHLQNRIITSDDYKPEFFALGYFSLPKRRRQTYMQPVYVATFKSLGQTTANPTLVIAATNNDYERIETNNDKGWK
jgi:hypothetical protein